MVILQLIGLCVLTGLCAMGAHHLFNVITRSAPDKPLNETPPSKPSDTGKHD